ncbi:conjugative transfer signal peptidase TraF [Piscinibacter defluvii]|uniref:conjugative transfer signal peptidase TraF n=1 Tax=Piscinibacter defluvii TaxID=1796922 RepID=UPI00197B2199|nr:conjugative transfer signal peptidase TraF [Piscinibacter defluvii]
MSTSTVTPTRLSLGPWLMYGVRQMRADLRRRWFVFAVVGLVWALALVRLFVHHVPVLPILFNWTPSLPYKVAVVDYGSALLARGDLVVYSFDGPAGQGAYPGLRHQALFKRVAGVAGDVVTVQGRDVFVNGALVGRAKTHAFDRRPLEPIAPTVIPAGQLYVQGTSIDSFDSRYSLSGLVRVQDVRAKVIPIL